MKHEITMPAFASAYDYHDFSTVREVLSTVLEKNVDYKEIQPPLGVYYAVFYTCKKEYDEGMAFWNNSDAIIEPLIKL